MNLNNPSMGSVGMATPVFYSMNYGLVNRLKSKKMAV